MLDDGWLVSCPRLEEILVLLAEKHHLLAVDGGELRERFHRLLHFRHLVPQLVHSRLQIAFHSCHEVLDEVVQMLVAISTVNYIKRLPASSYDGSVGYP